MREEAIAKVKSDMDLYGHKNTLQGVTRYVDENIMAKADLTELLEKMSGYNGNHQVVFEEEFARDVDKISIYNAVKSMKCDLRSHIVKKVNEEGKNAGECMTCDLPNVFETEADMELKRIKALSDFNSEGEYVPSVHKYEDFEYTTDKFTNYLSGTVDDMLDYFQVHHPELKANKGMKTSRLLNRIFEEYGLIRKNLNQVKAEDRTPFETYYFKKFAAYSDMINPQINKRKVVISTNPVDYLRMSFGNTWCSCHNIDKHNKRKTRGLYSDGARCAGTVSYALDNVTFIMYVLPMEADNNHPEDTDKIYRCMFQYQDGNLIQGRVYPQCKDGQLDLQKKLRQIMQKKLCEALEIPFVNNGTKDDTWKLCGPSYNNNAYYSNGIYPICWEAGHWQHAYPDWSYSYSGPVSYIKGFNHKCLTLDEQKIVIGHENVCMYCGKYESEAEDYGQMSNGWLAHYECMR